MGNCTSTTPSPAKSAILKKVQSIDNNLSGSVNGLSRNRSTESFPLLANSVIHEVDKKLVSVQDLPMQVSLQSFIHLNT